MLWHTKLGHPSASVLHSVFPSLKSCNPLNNKSHLLHCKHCLSGKMHQLPFLVSVPKFEFPLHVLHADLWGPALVCSLNGFKYYLVIVDDFTKFCWVYMLKHKSDTFSTFQQFKVMAEKHYKSSIHFLRTDCGGEFTSNEFNSFCANSGIIHHLTCRGGHRSDGSSFGENCCPSVEIRFMDHPSVNHPLIGTSRSGRSSESVGFNWVCKCFLDQFKKSVQI